MNTDGIATADAGAVIFQPKEALFVQRLIRMSSCSNSSSILILRAESTASVSLCSCNYHFVRERNSDHIIREQKSNHSTCPPPHLNDLLQLFAAGFALQALLHKRFRVFDANRCRTEVHRTNPFAQLRLHDEGIRLFSVVGTKLLHTTAPQLAGLLRVH
uniref:Uncharacterized protein n=1 Tax=Globodera rostochiensis TaxID=31243 RepID=A0A914HN39_GLORO